MNISLFAINCQKAAEEVVRIAAEYPDIEIERNAVGNFIFLGATVGRGGYVDFKNGDVDFYYAKPEGV